MATEKKYVSLSKLGLYDGKIKEYIGTKDAEALQSAKDYADGLAVNYDASGSAATALAEAKSYADGKDAAIAAAKKAGDDAAAAAAVADGKAVAAQTAADAAQSDVDALEAYVGTIPEGATATDVVGYVQEKTSGIATDTALAELQAQVTANKNDIATVKGDYLKASDKTELQGSIDAVDSAVDTLVGTDTGKSVRTIANEELVAQLIPETAQESLDTLQEIAAWIQAHPDDASAMNAAIEALQTKVGTIPEDATATTIVAYIQEVVNAEKSRAEGAESGLDARLDTLEAAVGESGSIATDIATAKQEAIDAAAADATSKANQALADAKSYADGLDTAMDARVDALESATHTHANKTELDKIADGDKAKWDDAASKAHTHANATVLDGITGDNITTWNTVTSKAAQSDLDSAVARITANEEAIASFVECSEEDINALFA